MVAAVGYCDWIVKTFMPHLEVVVTVAEQLVWECLSADFELVTHSLAMAAGDFDWLIGECLRCLYS